MENDNMNKRTKDLSGLGFFDFEPQGKSEITSIPFGFTNNGIASLSLSDSENGGMFLLAQDVSKIEAIQESLVLTGCMKYSPQELKIKVFNRHGSLAKGLRGWDLPHTVDACDKMDATDLCERLKELLSLIAKREQRLMMLGSIEGKQITTIREFNSTARKSDKSQVVPLEEIVVFIDDVYEIIYSAREQSERDELMQMLYFVISKGKHVGIYLVAGATPRDIEDYRITKAVSPYVQALGCFRLENGVVGELNLGVDFQGLGEELESLEENQLFVINYTKQGKERALVSLAEYDSLQKEEYVSAIKDNYYFFQEN